MLLRSKSSALIIIMGPLLVIFLVGIAFDNIDTYSIKVGVYSSSDSELIESFVQKMKENEIKVSEFNLINECIDEIKQEKIHTCIEFPKGFDIDSEKTNDLIFHVDYSKMNLVWTIMDILSTNIEEQESEISLGLTELLLDKLESTQVQIYNIQTSVDELKSKNEELILQMGEIKKDVLSIRVKDLKDSSSGIRTGILSKIDSARTTINTTKSDINNVLSGLNITTLKKENIEDKLSLIDTYLYNIYSMIEDPNNLTESDWTKVMNIIDKIEEDFNSIQNAINQLETVGTENSKKINEIKTGLDAIYNDIESIKITNATTIVNPINTEIKPVIPEKTYLNYLFPALIIMVVMFISILLSTTLVMMEKHSPAYFRTFLTPTRNVTFIISTYLTNIILVFVQVAIILGISSYFFKSQIITSLGSALTILLITTSLFTLIGMAIGYMFKSEETATLAAISTGSIFLFLSSVILPLESMPEYIAKIAQFNPFVLGESLLRQSILFQAEFSSLLNNLLILLIYSSVLFLLIWSFHIISRKHLLHRITLSHPKKQDKKA